MQLPITVKPCRKIPLRWNLQFRMGRVHCQTTTESRQIQRERKRKQKKGTEGAESTGNTEETEPEPEVKEAPNPMISYVLIGSLALIVIGAAYYFKVVRKKKEDFIEDEDEDEEDNEEYENEDEESEEDTEEDFFDEQGGIRYAVGGYREAQRSTGNFPCDRGRKREKTVTWRETDFSFHGV